MTGALDGIRVIDFGQYLAGPLAAQLLGDQGAEVIRVDPPGGPAWDAPANAALNRGKRSIALDLKREEDRTVAERLIASADVVIENFRPGVMDRLGLGAEACTAANPALVYCSLPGFAPDDPRASTPAYEGIVGAATGMYRRNRVENTPGPPLYSAIPVPSTYAAIQGAVSIAMALAARARDGLGQHITVPLFDAMFGALGYNGIRIHESDQAGRRPMGVGLTTQFECQDGRWVMFHTGNKRTKEVMEAAGAGEWVTEGLLDRERLASDPDLAREMLEKARELFKTRTAEEWEALVNEAGGECAVCRESAEWMEHPHALDSETVIETDDPELGRVKQPGIPARMSLTAPAVRGPRPRLDADREAILSDLADRATSPPPAQSNGASSARPVLDGVKVVDLCMVLAGPTCGRTLAEFGADVVKIQPPKRPPLDLFHIDVNRGKHDIILDLKTPEGLDVFWRLVDDADVVVQNFRKGVAEDLGIGYEQVRERRPDIVYASLNTYGRVGPFADRAGHEQIAQAATGMQARFGGDGAPRLQNFAVNDYGTGYLGAYAVALALRHRQRTGEGQHVDVALAYTATLLQLPFMLDYAGKQWDEPRGTEVLGSGPLHRGYEASDGWFFLGAREGDLGALAGVKGLEGIEPYGGAELAEALEERFVAESVATWVERLTAAGVGAHRVVSDARELMDDPWAIEHGLSIAREHGGLGMVTTIGPAPRLSRTPVIPGRPAPPVGSDAREILARIGLEDRLDAILGHQAAG